MSAAPMTRAREGRHRSARRDRNPVDDPALQRDGRRGAQAID